MKKLKDFWKRLKEHITYKNVLLSVQHTLAMFGATILVPLLTGMSIGVALVASGIGTLIYTTCTRGKVPVYLGSSFAYLGAIFVASSMGGFSSVYVGLMVVGIIYMTVATIIRYTGNGWIKKLLPPVVVGPMIIIIGLSLAGVAINNAGLAVWEGWRTPLLALIAFITASLVALKGGKFWSIVPFLSAIIVGYIAAWVLGVVNPIAILSDVNLFVLPDFTFLGTYKLDWSAALMFAPIAFVTIAEHIGDHTVLGEICEKDFITDPGLENTLMGDGIATFISGAMGGPANTTYGENTGVVAVTGVRSSFVTAGAAVIAIMLGFIGPIQAILLSIPWAVLGGLTIILYGLIASNGVKVMLKAKVDLSDMRNIIIVSSMLVIGLGGAMIPINDAVALTGMSFAAIVGILLNLVLPRK
jgi:uracil permease